MLAHRKNRRGTPEGTCGKGEAPMIGTYRGPGGDGDSGALARSSRVYRFRMPCRFGGIVASPASHGSGTRDRDGCNSLQSRTYNDSRGDRSCSREPKFGFLTRAFRQRSNRLSNGGGSSVDVKTHWAPPSLRTQATWPKDFMETGKALMRGDTVRGSSTIRL